VRAEEYYVGVAKKEGPGERESKQINKDKWGLMAVQEKL
jgi:hypothetical protein